MPKSNQAETVPPYQNEMSQITYVLSSTDGFGHASRAVAVAEALKSAPPLTFVAKGGPWHEYLNSNLLNYEGDVTFVEPDYEDDTSDKDYVRQNKDLIDVIASGRIVLNDFHIQVPGLRSLIEKSGVSVPLVGIYHSIAGYAPRDAEISTFQRNFREAAQQLDCIFLTEPKPEHDQPYTLNSGTLVVPIDPIVRQPTLDTVAVKTQLGIAPDEEYIYIQGGGIVNGEELERVASALQKLVVQGLKIVIALNGNYVETSDGNPTYIKPRPDGHNLIAASSGVISKAGMGTVCEAVAYRKPLLLVDYPTPEARTKFEMMRHLLGNALPFRLNTVDCIQRQIDVWLGNADEISERFASVPCQGASIVAKSIEHEQASTSLKERLDA